MNISPNAQLKIQLGKDGTPRFMPAVQRWNRKPFAPL